MSMFELGLMDGMTKAAQLSDVNDFLLEAMKSQVKQPSTDMVIASMPKPVAFVRTIEDAYGKIPSSVLQKAFKVWTVQQFADWLSKQSLNGPASKLASIGIANPFEKQKTHKRYMANRFHHIQQSKLYRTTHKAQVARKKKKYRMQVRMKVRRPRKRMGTGMGGFTFMAR